MPSKAPPSGPKLKQYLLDLGHQIHARRKGLKVSAVATAEAAGISRMTLNRIERGEPSVTLGAYINVISALGLELKLIDPKRNKENAHSSLLKNEAKIYLKDYPQLKKLAWQTEETTEVSLQEALNLYERNWRHVDLDKMKNKERKLIQDLLAYFGLEKLLV